VCRENTTFLEKEGDCIIMIWQLGPTPFISLNTQTEGVSVTHRRHRLIRYVVRKIHLEAVSEVTVVYALWFLYL
jgi:hypothetical protein